MALQPSGLYNQFDDIITKHTAWKPGSVEVQLQDFVVQNITTEMKLFTSLGRHACAASFSSKFDQREGSQKLQTSNSQRNETLSFTPKPESTEVRLEGLQV